MNVFFLKIVNMSISTSWLILAVLILRQILKKAPKWVNILLWGIVAARLLCPFSIESALSLIPSMETIPTNIEMDTTPAIDSGIKAINSIINPMISQSNPPANDASANPLQITIAICAIIWELGTAVLLIYAAGSCRRLRRKVDTAVLYRDNIFQSENVNSPFVLGIIRPKIYLPFKVDGQNLEHIVSHEQAHIHRNDHWRKPLGFLLLAVHWFNPLMWLSYVLFCRDIELACDETVIKELDNEQRAAYAQALLACSVNRRMPAACPLAFGEIGVRQRVKSIMNYKKPAFWMIMLSVTACAAAAVCFLTNPFDDPLHAPEPFCHTYRVEAIIYDAPQYSFTYTVDTAPQYTFTADYAFFEKIDTREWVRHHGDFQDVRLSASTFDDYFKTIDNVSGWQNDSHNAKNIRRNTKRAWRLDVEGEGNNVFYYLILAKNGDVYLSYGYNIGGSHAAAKDGSLIRWLFKLERTDLPFKL